MHPEAQLPPAWAISRALAGIIYFKEPGSCSSLNFRAFSCRLPFFHPSPQHFKLLFRLTRQFQGAELLPCDHGTCRHGQPPAPDSAGHTGRGRAIPCAITGKPRGAARHHQHSSGVQATTFLLNLMCSTCLPSTRILSHSSGALLKFFWNFLLALHYVPAIYDQLLFWVHCKL